MFYYLRDTKEYKRKPNSPGAIKNRLGNPKRQVTESIEQLAKDCLKYTVAPIRAGNHSKTNNEWDALSNEHWKGQQLMLLDFDNQAKYKKVYDDGTKEKHGTVKRVKEEHYLSIESAHKKCQELGIEPVFSYKTMSHKEDHHKYRLVFAFKEEITDASYRDQVAIALNQLFQIDGCLSTDSSVITDKGRIFYPGKELLYENYGARINAEDIINKAAELSFNVELKNLCYEIQSGTSPKVTSTIKTCSNNIKALNTTEAINAIKNNDVDYLRTRVLAKLSKGAQGTINVDNICAQDERKELSSLNPFRTYKCSASYIVDNDTKVLCNKILTKPQSAIISMFSEDTLHLLKYFPLDYFLDLPKDFNCIFHPDKKPSAYIKYHDETETWRYFCASTNCYFDSGDIFDVVQALQNTDFVGALNFLCKVFNIEIISEWQLEKKALIDEYIMALSDMDFLKKQYPYLYGFIWQHLPKLIGFLEIAKEHIYHKSMNDDGRVIFSISSRSLREKLNAKGIKGTSSSSVLNSRFILFHIAGLLKRLSDKDIPEHRLEEARKKSVFVNRQGKRIQSEFRTHYYYIPDFSYGLLSQANLNAKNFKDRGFSKTAFSFESTRRIFGENVYFIYPQHENKKISKKKNAKKDKLYNQIERRAIEQICTKGYTSKKEIASKIRGYPKHGKDRLVKELFPELRRKNKLKELKASNKLKKIYKIKAKGYPYIIVKAE